jgi:PAS domain S-box-containing protein
VVASGPGRCPAGLAPDASDAAPPGLRWLLRDVTARRISERALQYERQLSDGLLKTAQAAVLVLDAQGRILRCNPYLCSASSLPEAELRGRHWCALMPPDDHGAAGQLLADSLALGVNKRGTGRLLTEGGRVRHVAWATTPLADDSEKAWGVLVVGQDITELLEAQDQAHRAERLAALGQLTAALAHEGRNVLQRIQGGLDRLSWRLEGRPEEQDLVARVQAAQKELVRLFDDVRAFAGPLRLDRCRCNLTDVWRDAWQQTLAGHPGKVAHLAEDAGKTDVWCIVDRFRLTQVFRNILDNAVDACPEPVRVDVACREANLSGRLAVQVVVRDNGPGLGHEQRARIFEPFYTTKARGSGLGMAIAKRIVEAHGAEIDVGGEPGAGAEVRVTLPREG